ncbi:MarR family winged helix-turn-helix transcriptional regulator [Phenylobacterium sp.]|uniref:MarR family winged helix-turn-helix transcriptional regulator n=1 Tax=Phenylobacterium sp. TaxID=1871053 RepID=UPI0027356938|nr:MarR family transcriptional regulator [Phenylobacterium sp.]MDP3853004.1 MarR family transcriptional regulator [Phenylobacterium sp.]
MSNDSLTKLIAATHRAHDALVSADDKLLSDLGLSHARARVLAALADQGAARTVSQLARVLGVARQGVQRLADDLAAAGLIAFQDNPGHARAKLANLTQAGQTAHAEAERRRAVWAEGLTAGLSPTWLEIGSELLTLLRQRASAPKKA